MGEWFSSTAGSGSLLLAVPVALIAGAVSFFSPCVIPLVPGYLSYATGLSGADLADGRSAREHRGRLVAGSLLFVAGFATVFVLIGVATGAVGSLIVDHRRGLAIALGLLNIGLGLVFLGVVPALQRDWRVHRIPAVGLLAAPLLGFLFGLGWTPCISPTLGVITTLSLTEGTVARGALLSAFFALGLGLPFIAFGFAYERMLSTTRWVRRHQVWVMRLGGLMMIAVGVAMLTGLWDQWVGWLQLQLVDYNEVPV